MSAASGIERLDAVGERLAASLDKGNEIDASG
jgi:hypothetical protein